MVALSIVTLRSTVKIFYSTLEAIKKVLIDVEIRKLLASVQGEIWVIVLLKKIIL